MHTSLREVLETEVTTRVESYGDLIVQNLGAAHVTPAANLPNALTIDGELAEYDVMGEVDRYGADEAVLLAQKLRGLTVALQGTYTNEANIEFSYVFGFDSDRLDNQFIDDRGDEYGSSSQILVRNEINNDILYHVNGKATAGFEDTGVGTGAAPESFFTTDETNYLTEIGVLPEISTRENLSEYMVISSNQAQSPEDGSLTIYSSWQLYWLETDDEIEGRRVDLFEN